MIQINFMAESNRLARLTELGDSLEKLRVIDWEMFRPILEEALEKEHKGAGGRPPYDCILMFKILVLQKLYNISDDQTEYQINDRMSFMRFLGLTLNDKVPDAKTIWLYRDTLTKKNVIDKLFSTFTEMLESSGIITHSGTIVDATFVDAPRQRNSREENKDIKEGKIPESWQEDTPKAKHKLAQKDTDARWAKKGNETHYGYKDHAKVDADSKIITKYEVTSANVHDSKEFSGLMDETDRVAYADSAYIGIELPAHIENRVHEKGYKNNPLTEEQKASNRTKSKVRVRIEHVFGFMTVSMHGLTIRSIGIERAKFNIGLTNIVYNICRYAILQKMQPTMG